MKSFLTTLKFLTVFPWPRADPAMPGEISAATAFFPLVGFCLGLVLVFLYRVLQPYLASEILSVVLVFFLLGLTRALHLVGLRETFDRLGQREKSPGALKEGEQSGIGLWGLLAVLGVLAFKFRAIEVMGEASSRGLLLAPVLGRWSMVILAYGSEGPLETENRIVLKRVRGGYLFFATLLTLILVVIVAERLGLWIALWISLFALLARSYLRRRLGGIGLDNQGAVEEISETLALVLFATF